jgi:hypothetical protein
LDDATKQKLRYRMYMNMAEINDMTEDDHEHQYGIDDYKHTKEIQAKLYRKLTKRKFQDAPDTDRRFFTTKSGGYIFDDSNNPGLRDFKESYINNPARHSGIPSPMPIEMKTDDFDFEHKNPLLTDNDAPYDYKNPVLQSEKDQLTLFNN